MIDRIVRKIFKKGGFDAVSYLPVKNEYLKRNKRTVVTEEEKNEITLRIMKIMTQPLSPFSPKSPEANESEEGNNDSNMTPGSHRDIMHGLLKKASGQNDAESTSSTGDSDSDSDSDGSSTTLDSDSTSDSDDDATPPTQPPVPHPLKAPRMSAISIPSPPQGTKKLAPAKLRLKTGGAKGTVQRTSAEMLFSPIKSSKTTGSTSASGEVPVSTAPKKSEVAAEEDTDMMDAMLAEWDKQNSTANASAESSFPKVKGWKGGAKKSQDVVLGDELASEGEDAAVSRENDTKDVAAEGGDGDGESEMDRELREWEEQMAKMAPSTFPKVGGKTGAASAANSDVVFENDKVDDTGDAIDDDGMDEDDELAKWDAQVSATNRENANPFPKIAGDEPVVDSASAVENDDQTEETEEDRMLREWEESQKTASTQSSFFPKVDGWKKSAPGDVNFAGGDADVSERSENAGWCGRPVII